ncbi:hypothetical protein GYA54_03765 [Candidatus Kuenenbacteria bacterium]|nr:hypothetical protein [Candidatus Kuenenbacteria bacterium]
MEDQKDSLPNGSSPVTVVTRQQLIGPMELLSRAIDIYREKFIKIVYLNLFALASFLPLGLVFGLYFLVSSDVLGIAPGTKSILQIVLGLAGLVALVIAVFFNIAAQASFYLAPESAREEKATELFRRGRAFVARYFWVSFLVGVFTLLWTLLFIVPGIIMSVYYSLAVLCLVYEGHRATGAIKRSKEISKGYWWALAGRYLFLSLILFLFYLILSIPTWFLEEGSAVMSGWDVVTQIIGFFIAPVQSIYVYLIFRGLQSIKGEKKV